MEGGPGRAVHANDETWTASAVVSAVPWYALAELVPEACPELAPIVRRANAMASSPIVTVNLWFDRPVIDEPFIGLPGRAMQWVFDKRLVFGRLGAEGASAGGGVPSLPLVSSGAGAMVIKSNEERIRSAHDGLLDALGSVR